MKKICLLLLPIVFTLTCSCTGESNLLSLIPDNVQMIKKGLAPPQTENELVYDFFKTDIATLQDSWPNVIPVCLEEYFKTHEGISTNQLLNFLNSDEKFILQRNSNVDNGGGIAEVSYKKIYKKTQTIGEFYFYSGYFHGEASGAFGYSLAYIEGDEILNFILVSRIMENDKSFFSALPEIFIRKNGIWYWKNGNNSISELYAMMESHDERLPEALLELQNDWEQILENLRIDGVKVKIR